MLVILFFALTACGDSHGPAGTESAAVSLRLKWLVQAQSAGELVAASKGFCEAEGIRCTVRPGGPDFDAIKLVASGADDYGVTSADQLLLARAKGVPVVAIGVLFQDTAVCFFARTEAGVKSPRDFQGKKVGVKFGTNAETEYAVLLKRAGIDRSRVTEVPVKFDLSPFLTGQVDVWPGLESNEPLTVAAKGIQIHVLRSRDFGVHTYSNVYFTSEKRLKERPSEARRFMRAMAAGWRYAREHPAEAVQVVLKTNDRLESAHERAALELTLPLVFPENDPKRFAHMTLDGWQATLSVLVDGGLLERPPNLLAAFAKLEDTTGP
ncbi:MAG: ABC transporter substrate-binding protein [Burkholderiales bacterium]|nr:ABC transporter substrate-binding protein [Burkholderiales bacterium]